MTAIWLRQTSSKLTTIYSKLSNFVRKNKQFWAEDADFFWMQLFARFQSVRYWKNHPKAISKLSDSQEVNDAISINDSLQVVHQRLWNNGYYQGIVLSSNILQGMLHFSQKYPCYGDRDPELKFYIHQREQIESNLGQSFKLASYFDSHEDCESFQQLKNSRLLRNIAAQYLGGEPSYHRGDLMWSFPRSSSPEERVLLAQAFHCDINDYRTLKFFFYLTDVDEESGPHVYINGSHRNRSFRHQLMGQRIAAIPDQVLVSKYGPDQVCIVSGSAGFGCVGDPYVLHQGMTPRKQPRLLLQLEFGMKKYKTWYFNTP